jgi:hypothetical protein
MGRHHDSVNEVHPHTSDLLLQRYANLPLPADPTVLASLCAASVAALVAAETQIEQLQSRLVLTRRIGIVLGIVMTTLRIDEHQAEHLLRDRGKRLSRDLQQVAHRIIGTDRLAS